MAFDDAIFFLVYVEFAVVLEAYYLVKHAICLTLFLQITWDKYDP